MIWIWPANGRNTWRPLAWFKNGGVQRGTTWYHNSRMILDELWTNHEKPIKMIYNDLKWIILRQFRATPIWGSLHDDICRFCIMTVPCGISISPWHVDSNPGGSISWTYLNLMFDMFARCLIKCDLNETRMFWCSHLQNMSSLWSFMKCCQFPRRNMIRTSPYHGLQLSQVEAALQVLITGTRWYLISQYFSAKNHSFAR